MPPESQNQPTQTSEPVTPSPASDPTPPSNGGVSKKVVAGLIAAGLIFAVLVGAIIFLLIDKDNSSSSNDSNNNSSQNNEVEDAAVDQGKVVATLPSSDPNIEVELIQPRKVGNTLVVNYNLVNVGDETFYVNGFKAGVYTTEYGINAEKSNGGTAEPYAVSDSDGQKYALARDDRNEPLASHDPSGRIAKGKKISGYVTLTLPPSGSTVSVFLGDMSAFTGIKLNY